jgi:cation transport ATPase
MDHRTIAAGRHRVSGMTCDHCVAAITEEVGALDGVTSSAWTTGP